MSTQLPGFVLAGLYKDSLVITEETIEQNKPARKQEQVTNKTLKPNVAKPGAAKKWFLGDNRKNITIIIKDETAVHINEEWLATLTKLLTACKLNVADVAIVNIKNEIDFSVIKEQLVPQYVLMFDVSPNDVSLPFSIPDYQVQKYDGVTFMIAPGITLSADKTTESIKTEKRNLWEKLKIIFVV
jgi:hypothetical protein